MKTQRLWAVAALILCARAGNVARADNVPLSEATRPWLELIKSRDPAVRNAASGALVDIVRKHPAAAGDLVRVMAAEDNVDVLAEHERRLVPLAKESPATVSSFIRLIRDKGTNYRARNFGVKVLSQVGPAVGTAEFVDAMSETYCPVPGAYFRILRAMGKDAAPILLAAYRHPDANVRKRSDIAFRVIGRTEPTIQKLYNDLQTEMSLLPKVKEGSTADRIAAVAALAELARTTPGATTALLAALKGVSDKDILAEAETRLVALGRESPEAVVALVAGLRSRDNYRVRTLALKVLPKVGTNLNCPETIDALGDEFCPVPGMMRRILLAAGPDAMPVLHEALRNSNPDVREAAQNILERMAVASR